MLALLILTLLSLAATVVSVAIRLRALTERVRSLEGRLRSEATPSPSLPAESPLTGLRFALDIQQDHSHTIFASLLKDALIQEGAIPDAKTQTTIEGMIVCNGYADVYFRAELKVFDQGETLFTLIEKPSHGDRQENLVREIVARLKSEWPKRERQGALRELDR